MHLGQFGSSEIIEDDLKSYIIVIQKYSKSNGIRVLLKLARLIKNAGYPVYLFTENDNLNNEFNCICDISRSMRKNDIVIYPEIIRKNPLGFQNVVRYILYYPGVNGGDEEYDDYEYKVTYLDEYYPGADKLTIPSLDSSIFYKDDNVTKSVDCYFVHKRGKFRELENSENMIEINMDYPSSRKELGDLLRKTKTLYSYDDNSLILDEAYACGCKVKIIQPDGIYDWHSNYSNMIESFEKDFDKFIKKTQCLNYNGKIKKYNFEGVTCRQILQLTREILLYIFRRYVIKDQTKMQRAWFRAVLKLNRPTI